MKVATWNVNGIRARAEQVLAFVDREAPDVLCLQEIKASRENVPGPLAELPGYEGFWHGHKGYSGVALLLRRESFAGNPVFSHPPFDHETRVVCAAVDGCLFASIYVPNGGRDFGAKIRFLTALSALAEEEERKGTRLVLCGDLNVAREERDVHPTLRNADQIGQTPAERALLEGLLGRGLADLGRRFHPDDDQLFTWWAPWRKMKERNIGWRLDYVLASTRLAQAATGCEVQRETGTSDHGPVIAVFDLPRPERPPQPPPAHESRPGPGQLPLFGGRGPGGR
ncbi:MAG: exodeoxyribonuclease III [Myxococcales bacterium]